MKIKLVSICAIFLIFAVNIFAQSLNTRLDGLTRPRLTETDKKENKTINTSELEKLALTLINKERAAMNLKDLVWSDDAAKVARLHSRNMAENFFFNHRGLDGLMVDERAYSLGVKKWQAIGENIAFNRGYDSPTEFAVECWMNSAGHRANILNNRWTETGIGVAVASDGAFYFTEVFLERK
ncbi:MAG TPA: CAP domain-containing protein [Pyrinomonadaceae bacterium]|jgi:uncharacterized protein YkwD